MEMRFREMPFSQDWKKLNDRFFATIRVHKGDLKFAPDEKVDVVSPKRKFTAHVLLAFDTPLKKVPLGFLEYDLEARPGESRQDLINKLGKLYKFSERPDEEDIATIYFLEKL
jgi:hypothetical protein